MDKLFLTAEQCIWFLTLTGPQRRKLLKKLATGKFIFVWDAATHEYVLTPVE